MTSGAMLLLFTVAGNEGMNESAVPAGFTDNERFDASEPNNATINSSNVNQVISPAALRTNTLFAGAVAILFEDNPLYVGCFVRSRGMVDTR